jgi:hypothetical protein
MRDDIAYRRTFRVNASFSIEIGLIKTDIGITQETPSLWILVSVDVWCLTGKKWS